MTRFAVSVPRLGIPVAAALVFGLASTIAPAQSVRTLNNGEMEASFGSGCVVYYDNRGNRTHNRPGCSGDQIRRADNAVARRGDQYYGGGGGEGDPQVYPGKNGAAEVAYIGTSCMVFYGPGGVRQRYLPACSMNQVRRADDAMARYGGRPGYGGDYSGGYAGGPPEVRVDTNGSGRVVYRSNNCTVYYDTRGRRQRNLKSCSSYQLGNADDAMTRYRREQGYDGYGGGYGRPPEIVIDPGGSGRVIYRNDNCTVYYDTRGRRQGNPANCPRDLLNDADSAMARYRREQGM